MNRLISSLKRMLPQLQLLLCSVLIIVSSAIAQQTSELEQRVVRITEELRCLVCQNQSIADSHAELAVQLKSQVREQLEQGRSDAEIRDYMVQRYGDFVLYRPPIKTSTWLLWFGPALLLFVGAIVLIRKFRQAQQRLVTEMGIELDDAVMEQKDLFQEKFKS